MVWVGGSVSAGMVLWSGDGMCAPIPGGVVELLVSTGLSNFLFLRVILPDPSILTLYCLCGNTSIILPDLLYMPLLCTLTAVRILSGLRGCAFLLNRVSAPAFVLAKAVSLSIAEMIHFLWSW